MNHVRRFVFFSTIKAVGESPDAQDEDTGSLPSTPYGRSKRAAEQLVTEWVQSGTDRSALILRPSVVYGPGNTANIFALVQAIDRGRFRLIGRNRNVKSIVSVRNLCAAVEHLVLRMKPGTEIFNLVDARSYTLHELASMTAEFLGTKVRGPSLPLPWARATARVGDIIVRLTRRSIPLTTSRFKALTETSHFSCEKLLGTGFRHPQTTEEGLAEMVAWYRSYCSGVQRRCKSC